jgi:hypothetical protein
MLNIVSFSLELSDVLLLSRMEIKYKFEILFQIALNLLLISGGSSSLGFDLTETKLFSTNYYN